MYERFDGTPVLRHGPQARLADIYGRSTARRMERLEDAMRRLERRYQMTLYMLATTVAAQMGQLWIVLTL
jgi:hypothetical protein